MLEVVDAGVNFGVAAGLNERVVKKAQDLNFPFVPGVATATEFERAIGLGCTLLKFFPASSAGGATGLKALAGPYQHLGVKVIPLGGVNHDNMLDYLRIPIVGAIGGSWLANAELIEMKAWGTMAYRTAQALAIARDA